MVMQERSYLKIILIDWINVSYLWGLDSVSRVLYSEIFKFNILATDEWQKIV